MQLPKLFKVTKSRWVNAENKRVRATSPGAIKVAEQSKDWYAELPIIESAIERLTRKKNGKLQPRPIRVRLCQNKRAAKEMLLEMIESAERKAAGIIDYAEMAHRSTGDLVDSYRDHLLAKGNSDKYVELTINRIETVFADCRFLRVTDLDAEKAAVWLYKQRQETVKQAFNTRGIATSYKQIGQAFGVAERTVTYWRQQEAPITPRGKTDLAEVSA